MTPLIRLGFVVAPRWAVSALLAVKSTLDWFSPVPAQLAVAAFIDEGHLSHHVRKMRKIYDERRELLQETLRAEFSDWLRPVHSHYGVHIFAQALGGIDADAIASRLMQKGVITHSLRRYFHGRQTRSGLVMGYGCADTAQILRGLEILRSVIRGSSRMT
jgi:GntR family transcriptional regulator/MocR family aminotransferase